MVGSSDAYAKRGSLFFSDLSKGGISLMNGLDEQDLLTAPAGRNYHVLGTVTIEETINQVRFCVISKRLSVDLGAAHQT